MLVYRYHNKHYSFFVFDVVFYSNLLIQHSTSTNNASGCQETLRSKFPLKQPPRLFLHAAILLLTTARSNILSNINPSNPVTGSPTHNGISPTTFSFSTHKAVCINVYYPGKKQGRPVSYSRPTIRQ
jgi:hypothetical protein